GNIAIAVGGTSSNGVLFTVTPTLSSLSVTSGPVGTSVLFRGFAFGATQGTSIASFNAMACVPTTWTNQLVTCNVPLTATTGPALITQGGAPSNAITFTVTPSLNTLNPASGPVGTSV